MDSNDYHRNTGLDEYFKQTEGDRLDDIIFSKNYAETIAEIINFATIIYNKKLLICAYLYDDVSEDIRQVYQESITGDSLKKPNISYSAEDGQIKFKWNFMSLSEIIEIILLLNETSGRTSRNTLRRTRQICQKRRCHCQHARQNPQTDRYDQEHRQNTDA